MTTLFDATIALANHLHVLRTSTATGTTDTTHTPDTKRTEDNDTFNGGTIWAISADDAAPEGQFARVTDFANTGGIITHTAFTVATASGDTYGIAGGRYPLDVLISAINNELVLYDIPRYDTTSLDVVSGQSEYTLPTGIYKHNLRGVYEFTSTDSDDNRPAKLNFSVQAAATGTQHTLVIESRNITVGNDIMLEYTARLTPLYLATDTIDDSIPLALILPYAAMNAEINRMRTYASESQLDIAMLDRYERQAARADLKHRVRLPQRRGKVNESYGK